MDDRSAYQERIMPAFFLLCLCAWLPAWLRSRGGPVSQSVSQSSSSSGVEHPHVQPSSTPAYLARLRHMAIPCPNLNNTTSRRQQRGKNKPSRGGASPARKRAIAQSDRLCLTHAACRLLFFSQNTRYPMLLF
ncbi:hypothetical protein IWX92DRAFT_25588 [Phyllosticta citricarpa]